MTDNKPIKTELFPFPITPYLQKRLNSLSKHANPDGNKSVRWTDLILSGLSKLTPEDLVSLKRERDAFLNRSKGELANG